LLIQNKILAPKLYSENYKQNFIEIEDFGDQTVFNLLKKNNNQQLNLFKKSVQLLHKIQTIKKNKVINFKIKFIRYPVIAIVYCTKKPIYLPNGMLKNL
jgi:aminoglycoside/choline kinase family phosphotransferase